MRKFDRRRIDKALGWNECYQEFRWDRDVSGGVPVFGTAANPRRNSYTLALNVVYQF